jgi:tRNA threonylcarbamoyladenosine biosynthesis protein TsaB
VIILTLRTDKPEAELGLFSDQTLLDHETWQAHRELSQTIHAKIDDLLGRNQKTFQDVQGVVCFKGPGSFTGLRIGLSVVNTLCYALDIPVVSANDDDWERSGIGEIMHGKDEHIALPAYGASAHTTVQKH